jgi:HEAT repeat protein
MGTFRRRKPRVKALARRGNISGLTEAASYRDLTPTRDGTIADLGTAIREQAVVALGEIGTEAAANGVARSLHDPADRVRTKAVEVLEKLRQPVLIAEALPALRESGGEAHPMAMEALRDLPQPGTCRALVEALIYQDGDEQLEEDDATLVPEVLASENAADGGRDVIEALIRALTEREIVGDRAEQLLVLLAPISAEALQYELSNGGAAPHRAASALGKMKDAHALDALVNALDDPDPRVRAESCTALGELRDPAAVEPLLQATRDPEHLVRARAGSALDRIGAVAVVVGVSAMMRPLLADLQRAIPPNGAGAGTPSLESGTPRPDTTADEVAALGAPASREFEPAGGPALLRRRLTRLIGVEHTRSGE